jgi:ketosteroid isomerase-like protein
MFAGDRLGTISRMSGLSRNDSAGRSAAPGLLSGLTPAEQATMVFAAFDAKDVEKLASLVDRDVRLRLGNAEELEGKRAFVEAVRASLSSVASFHHYILDVWHERDVLIVELEVAYARHDGREVTLPCCNVFRLRDGFVLDYRVYMDISPVYA